MEHYKPIRVQSGSRMGFAWVDVLAPGQYHRDTMKRRPPSAPPALHLLHPAAHPHGPALTRGTQITPGTRPQVVQDRLQPHLKRPAGRAAQHIPGAQARQLRKAIHSSDIARVSPSPCFSSQIFWKQTCSRGAEDSSADCQQFCFYESQVEQ